MMSANFTSTFQCSNPICASYLAMSYFLIASRDDVPRTYDVPPTVNITTNVQLELEPYILSDPSYIVERLMGSQIKNEILASARLLGLGVKNKSSKLEIATALATKLVEGLEYVEVKEGKPSSSGNIDNDTLVSKIGKLGEIDTLFITKWLVNKSQNKTGEREQVSATAEAMNKTELLEIIKDCENKTVDELNTLLYSLFLQEHGKSLTMPNDDINLVKEGKVAQGHFYLAVECIGFTMRLKVIYDDTAKGSDLTDALVEHYGANIDAFMLRYGSSEGTSVIKSFDCLCSYMQGETPTVYLTPKQMGGAKNQDVKNKIVRDVVGKNNIKKPTFTRRSFSSSAVATLHLQNSPLLIFVQEGIGKVGVFCQSSDVDAKKALIDYLWS